MINDESITFDKIFGVLKKVKPLPFCGFTVTPAFWQSMQSDFPAVNKIANVPLGGVDVVVCDRQAEDCIQWNDKAAMQAWITTHNYEENNDKR